MRVKASAAPRLRREAKASIVALLPQQSGRFARQRIVDERGGVRRVEYRRPGKCGIKSRHEILFEIFDDADDARPVVVVRPAVQAVWRVEDMLHAVNDHRTRRIVRKRNDAFHAQQARAMRLTENIEKYVESGRRQGRVAGDAEGADVVVMTIAIRPVVVMRVIVFMIVRMVRVSSAGSCAASTASAFSHWATRGVLLAGS